MARKESSFNRKSFEQRKRTIDAKSRFSFAKTRKWFDTSLERNSTENESFSRRKSIDKFQIRSVHSHFEIDQSVKKNRFFNFEENFLSVFFPKSLIEIGEEFSQSDSSILQEGIRRQSVVYFRSYHNVRLEELKMFLENETWQRCPVKSTFHITQLNVR